MIKLFILAWLFIHPGGEQQMMTQAYTTLAACQTAGKELAEQSEELMKAKLLESYTGACVPTEIDTKGSI